MKRWQLPILFVLFVGVVSVSIAVVVNRHAARQLFYEIQQIEKEHDELNFEWSRLKLEQSAWLNQVSVEKKARYDLGMHKPEMQDIRIVKE